MSLLDTTVGHGPLTLEYCFEMEFMVAKERPGLEYSEQTDSSDSDGSFLCHPRWSCPADVHNHYPEILHECKAVFTKNNEPVVVRSDPESVASLIWTPRTTDSWILRPSVHAVPHEGSPSEYEWFGVKLRSPLFPEYELTNPESTVKWCLGALRMALRIHVNSTCAFNVIVQASGPGIGLTHFKKLATVVWLTEPEMLARLGTGLDIDPSKRMRSVTRHSRVAKAPIEGVQQSRPRDAELASAMDSHVPEFHDAVVQEKVQRLWACQDLPQLVGALRDSDGRPLAFSLHEPPSRNALGEPTDTACLAVFRYALWHPYDDLDVSYFWTQLALKICRVMETNRERYQRSARSTDEIIQGFKTKNVEGSSRWKILMDLFRLGEDWYTPWSNIIDEYRRGGKLSPRALDQQSWLGQIPELQIYKSR
ncbi:hypothetical protein CDD83_10045 [Cordyceps sp. RAO-2017]|nr:hypothetical protein CDD83_10045 [Cordyceps sp. RAO-2017]